MSKRKFPEPGTPLYDQIVVRVERGGLVIVIIVIGAVIL